MKNSGMKVFYGFLAMGTFGSLCANAFLIHQNIQFKAQLDNVNTTQTSLASTLSQQIVARYSELEQRLVQNEEKTGIAFQQVAQQFAVQENQTKALIANVGNHAKILNQQGQGIQSIANEIQAQANALQSINSQYAAVVNQLNDQLQNVGGNQAALAQNLETLYPELGKLGQQIQLINARQNALVQQVQVTSNQQAVIQQTLIPQLNNQLPITNTNEMRQIHYKK